MEIVNRAIQHSSYIHGRRCGRVGLVAVLVLLIAAVCPIAAYAHLPNAVDYDTVINRVEPEGLPIDVQIVDEDSIRFEVVGDTDAELMICGYTLDCEEYAKINADGVFVNKNAMAYYINLISDRPGPVPPGVGEGDAKWELIRKEPRFYTFHHHAIHWMGLEPPGTVDQSDPTPQKINDWVVRATFGGEPVEVHGTLTYIGGKTWIGRYGEYAIILVGVLIMVGVFAFDSRRRRRRASEEEAQADAGDLQSAMDVIEGAAEVESPEEVNT